MHKYAYISRLGEVCSHVAALLFKVEACACATWLLKPVKLCIWSRSHASSLGVWSGLIGRITASVTYICCCWYKSWQPLHVIGCLEKICSTTYNSHALAPPLMWGKQREGDARKAYILNTIMKGWWLIQSIHTLVLALMIELTVHAVAQVSLKSKALTGVATLRSRR